MKTLIERATDKGWTINTGTLQAKGLYNAIRNNGATDNDVTVWCASKNDAAIEALSISAADVADKPIKKKIWVVYDPHDKRFACALSETGIIWSDKTEKAAPFPTKATAQRAVRDSGHNATRMVYTSKEVRA